MLSLPDQTHPSAPTRWNGVGWDRDDDYGQLSQGITAGHGPSQDLIPNGQGQVNSRSPVWRRGSPMLKQLLRLHFKAPICIVSRFNPEPRKPSLGCLEVFRVLSVLWHLNETNLERWIRFAFSCLCSTNVRVTSTEVMLKGPFQLFSGGNSTPLIMLL